MRYNIIKKGYIRMANKLNARMLVILFVLAMVVTAVLPLLEGFKRLLIILEFFSMLYVVGRA